jgi:hypothetical protein
MQQQAQINELLHYARKETVNPEMVKRGLATPMKIPLDAHGFPHTGASLNLKCIVQIRIMGAFTAADLSPHNPGGPAASSTRSALPPLCRTPSALPGVVAAPYGTRCAMETIAPSPAESASPWLTPIT